jgi:hypothetical protein
VIVLEFHNIVSHPQHDINCLPVWISGDGVFGVLQQLVDLSFTVTVWRIDECPQSTDGVRDVQVVEDVLQRSSNDGGWLDFARHSNSEVISPPVGSPPNSVDSSRFIKKNIELFGKNG